MKIVAVDQITMQATKAVKLVSHIPPVKEVKIIAVEKEIQDQIPMQANKAVKLVSDGTDQQISIRDNTEEGDKLKSAAKYTASIRDFPTPTNISDARSWYGLVNQVAYCFNKIIEMIQNGVFSFDPKLRHVSPQITQRTAWVGSCSRRRAHAIKSIQHVVKEGEDYY